MEGFAFFGVIFDGRVFELHGVRQKFGTEVAGLDAGDGDAEISHFIPQGFGQAIDGEFGRAVYAAAGNPYNRPSRKY